MTAHAPIPADRLAKRTLELVDIPSQSRAESALAEHVRSLIPAPLEIVHAQGNAVYARVPRSERPFVLFAGHLDTVPAQENLPGRIEDGAVIGCGSTDMKAGLAVMIELARWIAAESPELDFDPGFLFFPREELPPEESSLPALFAALPELDEAALVIVMEPTDNEIQAGCLGNLYARVVFRGESAHSARPWQGVNAIEVAIEELRPRQCEGSLPHGAIGLRFEQSRHRLAAINVNPADYLVTQAGAFGLETRHHNRISAGTVSRVPTGRFWES